MFCKYCGKELKEDAEFCPYCGKEQTPDDAEKSEDIKKDIPRRRIHSNNTAANKKESKVGTSKSYAKGSSLKRGVLIAIGLIVIIAVISIVGALRNTGSATDINTTASKSSTSRYSEQIDTIMFNFEDFIESGENGESANTSYRMFELLCVFAEELDESGTYATTEVKSAKERYQTMDAQITYGNLQIVNGLYRCVEMLSVILYELEGEESVQQIEEALSNRSIAKTEPTVDNFLECQGSAAYAIYEYLHCIVKSFDLPDQNMEKIESGYEEWTEYMNTVDNERNKVAYSHGRRQYMGSLYYVYQLLKQTVSGLDSSREYSDDLQQINEELVQGVEDWEDGLITVAPWYKENADTHFLANMLNNSTRLLAILTRMFS